MAKGNWSIYKSTERTKYKRCFQKGIYDAKIGNIFGTYYPIHVEDYPAKRGYIGGFKEKTVKIQKRSHLLGSGAIAFVKSPIPGYPFLAARWIGEEREDRV